MFISGPGCLTDILIYFSLFKIFDNHVGYWHNFKNSSAYSEKNKFSLVFQNDRFLKWSSVSRGNFRAAIKKDKLTLLPLGTPGVYFAVTAFLHSNGLFCKTLFLGGCFVFPECLRRLWDGLCLPRTFSSLSTPPSPSPFTAGTTSPLGTDRDHVISGTHRGGGACMGHGEVQQALPCG